MGTSEAKDAERVSTDPPQAEPQNVPMEPSASSPSRMKTYEGPPVRRCGWGGWRPNAGRPRLERPGLGLGKGGSRRNAGHPRGSRGGKGKGPFVGEADYANPVEDRGGEGQGAGAAAAPVEDGAAPGDDYQTYAGAMGHRPGSSGGTALSAPEPPAPYPESAPTVDVQLALAIHQSNIDSSDAAASMVATPKTPPTKGSGGLAPAASAEAAPSLSQNLEDG